MVFVKIARIGDCRYTIQDGVWFVSRLLPIINLQL